MRYERLVAHPAGHLTEIRTMLDLPPDPLAFIRHDGDSVIADLGPSHSVAGNPMRFESGGVRLRTDSAWRTAMPAGKRRLAALLTAHGVKLTFQAVPGMHEYKVWRQGLHDVAPRLFTAEK